MDSAVPQCYNEIALLLYLYNYCVYATVYMLPCTGCGSSMPA
jgi:hypothetical protein